MNIVAFEYVCFFSSITYSYSQKKLGTDSAFPILFPYSIVVPYNNQLEDTSTTYHNSWKNFFPAMYSSHNPTKS